MANKKRGRTASETSSGGGGGGSASSGVSSAGSFLGKQFSFATSSGSSGINKPDVISTQPTAKPTNDVGLVKETPFDARSDTSSTSTITAGSSGASYSSKPSSSVLDTFEQESKYKPVTNFEPQERVNPFDKGALKTSATNATIGSASTTSSSSISSSSISSRINRNGNAIKSPPPPTGPPPPPPLSSATIGGAVAADGANATANQQNNTNSIASTYMSSTATGKTTASSYNYGSSTSIDTITRMDTTNTTTATIGSGIGASASTGSAGAAVNTVATINGAANNSGGNAANWRSNMGIRSASVYSAPAAVTTVLPGDTSGYASNNSSPASQNAFNNPTDLPSYTRPSYSRSESNGSNKVSDLDIIFGGPKATPASSHGNGKLSRSGGSLSDAELVFGGPTNFNKIDRFGASKSMSVTSDRSTSSSIGAGNGAGASYKMYEGIQNAAFSDYSDSPTATGTTTPQHITDSVSSITSYSSGNAIATNRWSKPVEEDDELDLK